MAHNCKNNLLSITISYSSVCQHYHIDLWKVFISVFLVCERILCPLPAILCLIIIPWTLNSSSFNHSASRTYQESSNLLFYHFDLYYLKVYAVCWTLLILDESFESLCSCFYICLFSIVLENKKHVVTCTKSSVCLNYVQTEVLQCLLSICSNATGSWSGSPVEVVNSIEKWFIEFLRICMRDKLDSLSVRVVQTVVEIVHMVIYTWWFFS